MPLALRDAPAPNRGILTLDIAERQILVYYEVDPMQYHHRILVCRVEAAKWLVITPTLDVHTEDYTDMMIVPLPRGGAFPLEGGPFFVF